MRCSSSAGSCCAARRSVMSPSLLPLLLLLVVALCCLAPAGVHGIGELGERWTLTSRLRELANGHPHYQYSTSFHSLGRIVAVGSVTANMGRGEVRILHDDGSGLKTIMTLVDPEGIIHDNFGSYVRLFEGFGALHLIVSATGKRGDGAFFLYKQEGRVQDWILQEVVFPPDNLFVNDFGRSTHYDGVQLLVSAERRYVSGRRFRVSAINWKGTRFFQETTGVDPMPPDPIFVYRPFEGRANSTFLRFDQIIEDGDFTTDFGASIAISGDRMAVGASSRDQLKFGHGTDGLLEVTGVRMLDGAAEYNFDTVIVRAGGVLTTERFASLRGAGGVLALRVRTALIVEPGGVINMSAVGFPGGPTGFNGGIQPADGDFLGGGRAARTTFTGFMSCDYDGSSSVSRFQLNEVSGGVGRDQNSSLAFAEPSGGGGGYGTRGEDGTPVQCGTSGAGGATYGDDLVTYPFRGSGGGSGHPWRIGSGGAGGRGGGAIIIAARRIENHGIIECNGGDGENGGFFSGGGGGGSGGSIVLVGETLANYGHITAVGGRGGLRASGSGSDGTPDVRGGHGGVGRIRFDFLATQSFGIVVPHPTNVTTFQGDVYLYRRVQGRWAFETRLPRLPGMMFIGQAVALDGELLVVASDERVFISPQQRVYVIDIRHVQNESSPIHRWRVIEEPDPADEKFGHGLAINNQTLVITAAGSPLRRGVVYIHQGRDLVAHSTVMTTLTTLAPQPGDAFGATVHLAFPELYAQLPSLHDDNLPFDPRRSAGTVHLYKFVRNISVENSFVTCEYDVITANVTLNCTVEMVDRVGVHVGDLNEIPYISPPVDFRSVGVYTFQLRRGIVGSFEVAVTHKQRRVRSFHLEVTNAIVPEQSNITCTPHAVEAGQPVTCSIFTNGGSGEAIARREFDVFVFNMADAQLSPTSFDTETPLGIYRSPPPSEFIQTEALRTDFPTVQPAVAFVRRGIFSFTFTPWRAGPFAAFVMYKRVALSFPNPVITQARVPPVDTMRSVVTCPRVGAPNRTVACVVQLRGEALTPAGMASLVANFSSPRHVTARIDDTSFPVTAVWSGVGRVSLLVAPTIAGMLRVEVRHHDHPLAVTPTDGIDIRELYELTCARMSLLRQSWTMLNQHALGRADALRYGALATRSVLADGIGMCDDWRI